MRAQKILFIIFLIIMLSFFPGATVYEVVQEGTLPSATPAPTPTPTPSATLVSPAPSAIASTPTSAPSSLPGLGGNRLVESYDGVFEPAGGELPQGGLPRELPKIIMRIVAPASAMRELGAVVQVSLRNNGEKRVFATLYLLGENGGELDSAKITLEPLSATAQDILVDSRFMKNDSTSLRVVLDAGGFRLGKAISIKTDEGPLSLAVLDSANKFLEEETILPAPAQIRVKAYNALSEPLTQILVTNGDGTVVFYKELPGRQNIEEITIAESGVYAIEAKAVKGGKAVAVKTTTVLASRTAGQADFTNVLALAGLLIAALFLLKFASRKKKIGKNGFGAGEPALPPTRESTRFENPRHEELFGKWRDEKRGE